MVCGSDGIFQPVRFTHMPDIAHMGIETTGSSGSEMRQGEGVEFMIGQQRAGMAGRTFGFAIEEVETGKCRSRKSGFFSIQMVIKRAVERPPFEIHERTKGIANMGYVHVNRTFYIVKSLHELLTIFGDDANPFCQDWPNIVDPVMGSADDFIFLWIASHFELGGHGKYGLSRKNCIQPLGQPFFGGRVVAVSINI